MKQNILLLFLFIISISLNAQEVVSTSGDCFEKPSGSITFTLGECVTETFESGNVMLTQGFHQPVLKVTSIESVKTISVTAFPNPTSDILYLQINEESISGYYYELYDITGKQLSSELITKSITEIPFSNRSFGTYLLKIFKDDKSVQTLKIIKE